MIELDDLDASEGDDDGAGLSWARARDLAALEGPNRPPPPVDCWAVTKLHPALRCSLCAA